MHTPSKTQQRILTAAAKEPTADIPASMTELKSPAIRDKVLQSMIKHGYVAEQPLAGARPEKGEKIYTITESGMATVPNTAEQDATPCNTRERETKQAAIVRLLSQEAEVLKESLNKTLHAIVRDLGFTGALGQIFFDVSKSAIRFSNHITDADLEAFDISPDSILPH